MAGMRVENRVLGGVGWEHGPLGVEVGGIWIKKWRTEFRHGSHTDTN